MIYRYIYIYSALVCKGRIQTRSLNSTFIQQNHQLVHQVKCQVRIFLPFTLNQNTPEFNACSDVLLILQPKLPISAMFFATWSSLAIGSREQTSLPINFT